MARTGVGWLTTPAIVAVVVALGLAGCGEASDLTAVRTSVHAYITALANHDVAAACAMITPAYWSAWAAEVTGGQQANHSAAALPRADCKRGLESMFSHATTAWPAVSTYSLTDLQVHGDIATAHLTLETSRSAGATHKARFIKASGGVWRMDCCTGGQLPRSPWSTYWIASESMEPTVDAGQRVTADSALMRGHGPSEGDIVVFHPPTGAMPDRPVCGAPAQGAGHSRPCGVSSRTESTEMFIKRVVGLPGDRIAIVDGHVIRNGKREKDPYILPCLSIDAAECTFPEAILVPSGEYYVLGDNRGASDDSRFWGPVRRSWIIAVVKR